METNIFDKFVSQKTLFKNKETFATITAPRNYRTDKKKLRRFPTIFGKPSKATYRVT
jgi:hypothetical protein